MPSPLRSYDAAYGDQAEPPTHIVPGMIPGRVQPSYPTGITSPSLTTQRVSVGLATALHYSEGHTNSAALRIKRSRARRVIRAPGIVAYVQVPAFRGRRDANFRKCVAGLTSCQRVRKVGYPVNTLTERPRRSNRRGPCHD